MTDKQSKRSTNPSGDQPLISQVLQASSEPRTRSQTAKLARTPDMNECTSDDHLQVDPKCQCKVSQKWFDVIGRLQTSLSSLEGKMDAIAEVRRENEALKKSTTLLKKEAKTSKFKLNMLTNVIIRLEEKVDQQAEKLIQMQARSMRKNIIISGLDEPPRGQVEKDEDLLSKINDFIANKLKISASVPLKVFHRFGQKDGSGCRPVVIKLQNPDQKFQLLAKGPNLKDQSNLAGKKYYISEQLPEAMQEERRYSQFWIQENKKESRFDMKIKKNKLHINNQPYKKKVKSPTAAEVLRLDGAEIMDIRQVHLFEGGSKDEQGSEFLGYAAVVHSAEEVRKAYRKLKIKYADASHISSAYRLAPPNGPLNQEAADDGEHGMGRALLKLLHDMHITNAVVFVIRYFGGTHIGPIRFDIARNLARRALDLSGMVPRAERTRRRSASSIRGRGRGGIQGTRNSELEVVEHPTTPSDSEPEVVTQFRKAGASTLLKGGTSRPFMGASVDETESQSEIGSTDSESGAEQTRDEETDYDEALSQPGEDMPPLETTQQNEAHRSRMEMIAQRKNETSSL